MRRFPQTILSDGRTLNYDKMLVMGILNITPDSFYAGSRVPQLEQVVEKAGEMLRQGAAVLDIWRGNLPALAVMP